MLDPTLINLVTTNEMKWVVKFVQKWNLQLDVVERQITRVRGGKHFNMYCVKIFGLSGKLVWLGFV